MKRAQIQIDAKEYLDLDYLDKPRWISMWHQIQEVVDAQPKTVLEVGIGNGVVASLLHRLGYKVSTLDIDNKLHPTMLGDVRKIPLPNNSSDVILCAQVLEHIPFSDFPMALSELYRVTKKQVILTIPHDYLTYFLWTWKILPFVKPVTIFATLPRWQRHVFNGQHYWEIGKRGYPLKKVICEIEKVGFIHRKTYILPENPYHRFFILKKGGSL